MWCKGKKNIFLASLEKEIQTPSLSLQNSFESPYQQLKTKPTKNELGWMDWFKGLFLSWMAYFHANLKICDIVLLQKGVI